MSIEVKFRLRRRRLRDEPERSWTLI